MFANPRKAGAILWIIQALLAALFLFAGAMKFIMPVAEMTKQSPPPPALLPYIGAFLHFIAACELLGAVGLILPGLVHVHEELTPLAASGLVIIMIGAVAVTVATMGVLPALFPFVTGCLAAFVAYGRRRLAAWRQPRARAAAEPAR